MQVGGRGREGPRAEINVTPLVDVVLVLLIIFMVVTPLIVREMHVAIPPRAEIEAPEPSQQVVLRYTQQRRVFINEEEVEIASLGQRLREVFQFRSEKVLFLDVEEAANYGEAVRVMDACRAAGVSTLGIVTH